MRPLSLKMTAFGPYANTLTLDFEQELMNHQIFVITGVTGAGKSSLFDAICYALYGEAASTGRRAESLRSDFEGNSSSKTEVEFLFEVSGKRYKIMRSPKQWRARTRSEGFREVPATVSWHEMDSDAEPLTRDGDVKVVVHQILGLTADQFKKIVMIPQGDFKEFLTANTSSKEEILRKIFGTEIYKQIQERLNDEATTLKNSIIALRQEIENLSNTMDIEEDLTERQANIQIKKQMLPELEEKLHNLLLKTEKLAELHKAETLLDKLSGQKQAFALKDDKLTKSKIAKDIQPLEKEVKNQQTKIEILMQEKTANDNKRAKAKTKENKLIEKIEALKKAQEQKLSDIRKEAEQLRAKYQKESQIFISATASRLASELEVDLPCPVCGSIEHPSPASGDELSLAESELKALQASVRKRDNSLNVFLAEMGRKSEPELAREKLQIDLTTLKTTGIHLEEQISREISNLEEISSKFETLLLAKFEGISAYEACKLDEVEIENLENDIAEFKQLLYTQMHVVSTLQSELQDANSEELAPLEKEFQELKVHVDAVKREITEFEVYAQNQAKLMVILASKGKEVEKLEAKYAICGELAELVNGRSESKISFETFVLSSYFDDVLVAANERLEKMTAGRYFLVRQVKVAGGGRKGLDIDVYDVYTSKARHVSTLSGGESFMVSLALALGLSDVVARNIGAIRLDTMFIDEGFGTLDSESLDLAVDILMDLQDYGRLIGVISHVEELKSRIPAKLVVTKMVTGSTAEFVTNT